MIGSGGEKFRNISISALRYFYAFCHRCRRLWAISKNLISPHQYFYKKVLDQGDPLQLFSAKRELWTQGYPQTPFFDQFCDFSYYNYNIMIYGVE